MTKERERKREKKCGKIQRKKKRKREKKEGGGQDLCKLTGLYHNDFLCFLSEKKNNSERILNKNLFVREASKIRKKRERDFKTMKKKLLQKK